VSDGFLPATLRRRQRHLGHSAPTSLPTTLRGRFACDGGGRRIELPATLRRRQRHLLHSDTASLPATV